jgi:tetratricopeptide (TPR) repeat protein
MPKRITTGLILLCTGLLVLCCTLRTGLLVDRTFILRFVLLALILLVTFFAGARRWLTPGNNIMEICFTALFLWSLASTIWSVDPAESVIPSMVTFLSLVLFLTASGVTKEYPAFETIFIRVMIILLFLSFGLAFLKMMRLPYFDPYKVVSLSANNNLYSGFLLISLPLLFAGYSLLKRTWRYLAVAAGILNIFFIIILQSRAVYLGLVFSVIFGAVILAIRYRPALSGKNLLTGAVSLLVLACTIFLFTTTLDITRRTYFLNKLEVWNYFQSYDELQANEVLRFHGIDPGDHSRMGEFDFAEAYYSNASMRLIFWERSAELIASHPVRGVGAGNWRLVVPGVKDPPNPGHTAGNYTYSQPHNEWICIASELGIVGGLLAFFVFFFPVGFILWRIFFSKEKISVPALFYASFLAGFYLYACFDFPFRRIEHNIVFWPVMAFMLVRTPLPVMKNPLTGKLSWKFRNAFFLVFLLFALLVGVARVSGEYFTLKMFRVERQNDDAVIRYATKAENPFYRITPNALPVSWFKGVAFFRQGKTDTAEKCFVRALKLTPFEVRVMNDHAAALYKLGRTEDAIRELKETLSIDPFFDDARFNLAAIYFLNGDKEEARRQILQCRESDKKADFLKEMEKN